MQITPVLYDDHLEVSFTNTSSTTLRLWELWNSWGAFSVSFQIRRAQSIDVYTIKRDQNMEFTVNFPGYFVLMPGESQQAVINFNDGYWEWDAPISRLKNETLYLRVSYNVNPTPEAEKYGVFVGSVLSDWEVSQPLHGWLFAVSS